MNFTTESLGIWLIDHSGNVAISAPGLALLRRIEALRVPKFASTEHAIAWGSCLNAEQHDTLLDMQRTSSNAAREQRDLQSMVDRATRSQLIREAAEAFVPGYRGKPFSISAFAGAPVHASSAN
jgi:hypothetical protein